MSQVARVFGRPDHPPNGLDGTLNGPYRPPNGLDGPPNDPDGAPNGADGSPKGPDGGAVDRRLRPWYLTRGWIMSHLYICNLGSIQFKTRKTQRVFKSRITFLV